MTAIPPVPHTPEEIAAAKVYLREAFTHAVENLDKNLQSAKVAEEKELHIRLGLEMEEEYQAAMVETRALVVKLAAEVAAGTPEGEKFLDHAIDYWQHAGELPDFFTGNSPS